MAVSRAANAFCLQRSRKTFSSRSNIRPVTTRPAVLYSQCYLVVSVIYIHSLRSHGCGHIHILHNIEILVWPKKIKKKNGTPVNVSCNGNFPACHFGNASPAVGLLFAARTRLLVYKCAHIAATKPVLWLKARAL